MTHHDFSARGANRAIRAYSDELHDVFETIHLTKSSATLTREHTFEINSEKVQPKRFCGQFYLHCSSGQSLDRMGRRGGGMRDDPAEILFQSFLQEALVSRSGMGRYVHSLMLFIQHFFCRPRCRPFSEVPWRMVLERLSWRVIYPNHAIVRLLTVARRGSCTQSLVFQVGDTEKFP